MEFRIEKMSSKETENTLVPQCERFQLGYSNRIYTGRKSEQASEVPCNYQMPLQTKKNFYKTTVKPALLDGVECWTTTKQKVKACEVEMSMLR